MNYFVKPPNRTIPERLIYKQPVIRIVYEDVVTAADYNAYEYRMCDTKTGDYLGKMIAGPMVCRKNIRKSFYPIDKDYKSFYIDELHVTYPNEGVGSDFINLAKHESRKYDCMGRIHLVASRIFAPTRPPHIFYRKLGFTSNKPKINQHIDWCIKHKRKMHWTKADNLEMYLPIAEPPKKSNLGWRIVKKILKHIF